jgi:hypothetical protein
MAGCKPPAELIVEETGEQAQAPDVEEEPEWEWRGGV